MKYILRKLARKWNGILFYTELSISNSPVEEWFKFRMTPLHKKWETVGCANTLRTVKRPIWIPGSSWDVRPNNILTPALMFCRGEVRLGELCSHIIRQWGCAQSHTYVLYISVQFNATKKTDISFTNLLWYTFPDPDSGLVMYCMYCSTWTCCQKVGWGEIFNPFMQMHLTWGPSTWALVV